MSKEISLIVAALTEKKIRHFDNYPPKNARFYKYDDALLSNTTLPIFNYDYYDAIIRCNDDVDITANNLMLTSSNRETEFTKLIPFNEKVNNKTIYEIDLPSSSARIMLDYLYWRPIKVNSIIDVDIFINWLEKPSDDIINLLKKSLLEILKPEDCLLAWKLFYQRDFFEVVDYCVYHFPLEYKKNDQVTKQFLKMPLNDVVCLLSDNWLNVESEVEVVNLIKDWILHNQVDETSLKLLATTLKVTSYNVDELREVTKDIRQINEHVQIKRTNRRFQRDFVVFYGLYDHRHAIAYVLDMERKELVRTPKLDNTNRDVCLPIYMATDEAIYQVGGSTGELIGFAMADVFRLDKKTLKWERRSSLPIARCHSSVTAGPKGKVFVVGGHTQMQTTRMQCCDSYNPSQNVWKKLPNLIKGRFKAACAYAEDKLFVTGGATSERALSDCEFLTQESKQWKPFNHLNFPRSAHQMIYMNGKLYVLGGRNFTGDLHSVETYTIETGGTWKMSTDMLKPRADFSATVFQNKIFVFGGEGIASTQLILTVDYFDGNDWYPFCTLPADVSPLSAFTFPMLPKVEEIASRMFATSIVEEPETAIQRRAIQTMSYDSGHESDDEFSGGLTTHSSNDVD